MPRSLRSWSTFFVRANYNLISILLGSTKRKTFFDELQVKKKYSNVPDFLWIISTW